MKKVYHSALKPEIDGLPELSFWEFDGNIVFSNDVVKDGIVSFHFDKCDVFYSEPAWKDGYDEFLERASLKSKDSSYLEYVMSMSDFVRNTSKPIYLVLGSHVLKEFPKPEIVKIKLHGYSTNLCVWNDHFQCPDSPITNYDVMRLLAEKYDCVGDFNAGYGNIARIFQENGKKFVCSDINKSCVYYIANKYMQYGK